MIHDIIGHISFGISAVSFMMRKILYLRLLAICSLIMSLYYNYALPTGPLWVVIFWLCIFLIINFYQSGKLVVDNMEVSLTEDERDILSKSFPTMRSRDFKRLLSKGTERMYSSGETIADKGSSMSEILLVLSGELTEKKGEFSHSSIRRGQMLGEATFVLHDDYGRSPSDITSHGNTTVISWKHNELSVFLEKYPDTKRALLDGIIRGFVKKQGILLPDNNLSNQETISEVPLSFLERKIHALSFPKMMSGEVKAMIAKSTELNLNIGEEINNDNIVCLIAEGEIIVNREDEHHIRLGQGHFLGEIAWSANGNRNPLDNKTTATKPTKILYWTFADLEVLKKTNPGLFASFTYHILQDMGKKLVCPLSEGNVYNFG